MTVELGVLRKGSWWKYWPCFAAGLVAPLLGDLLARWIPFHFAVGIAFFVAWFFVGVIFAKRWRPKYDILGWLAAILMGLGAGLGGGVLAYYIPWR